MAQQCSSYEQVKRNVRGCALYVCVKSTFQRLCIFWGDCCCALMRENGGATHPHAVHGGCFSFPAGCTSIMNEVQQYVDCLERRRLPLRGGCRTATTVCTRRLVRTAYQRLFLCVDSHATVYARRFVRTAYQRLFACVDSHGRRRMEGRGRWSAYNSIRQSASEECRPVAGYSSPKGVAVAQCPLYSQRPCL